MSDLAHMRASPIRRPVHRINSMIALISAPNWSERRRARLSYSYVAAITFSYRPLSSGQVTLGSGRMYGKKNALRSPPRMHHQHRQASFHYQMELATTCGGPG